MSDIRELDPAHREPLLAFLGRTPQTTMFLRSNLTRAGIEYRGARFEGTYAAAFEQGRIVAVVAHYWHGGLTTCAPCATAAVAQHAIDRSGRPVQSIVGPYDETVSITQALGVDPATLEMDSREVLYGLRLADLNMPRHGPSTTARRGHDADVDRLVPWRAQYEIDLSNIDEAIANDPQRRVIQRDRLQTSVSTGDLWILEHAGVAVAMCSFNARMPDCVQVGGVFTPHEHRSRGYGRLVVAKALAQAHAEGVASSVLFTSEHNRPAQRAYEAIGYTAIGDYGIRKLSTPYEADPIG